MKLVAPDGQPAAIDPAEVALSALAAGETISRVIAIPVAAPRKWDAEHPNLYTLTYELQANGKTTEVFSRRIGFRQVEVRGAGLFVNNQPVKLRGACRHETHPLLGRALRGDLWRKDVELLRAANCNHIRTSHYPPAEEFIDACDELGMFVEEEAPICWADGNKPAMRDLVVRQTLAMVKRDRSHPSVIFWSLGNESQWGESFQIASRDARLLDPTRPQTFNNMTYPGAARQPDDSWCEIATDHYPGLGGAARYAEFKRPVSFGEYCHLNCYNREELAADPGVRDYWGRAIADEWNAMYAGRTCIGGSIWAAIDDFFLMPSGRIVGYGPWGPLDNWRRPKPEYWHLKKAYSPVRFREGPIAAPSPGQPIRLDVENRHDFTNLRELRFAWIIGETSGTASTDVPPRSNGVLTIDPRRAGDIRGRSLSLDVVSPRGFLIDSYLFPIGAPPRPAPPPAASGKATLAETDAELTATTPRVRWIVDRRSGMIRRCEAAGRAVLSGGPFLTIVPLVFNREGCDQLPPTPPRPVQGLCTGWTARRVEAKQIGDRVEIRVEGDYNEAAGRCVLTFDGAGGAAASYRFVCRQKIDPRQIGVTFDLPLDCQTLAWRRLAQWSVYPPDHIGRPAGTAHAFRDASWPRIGARQEPPWPWALDSNALGTNDFRATRNNILWVSLRRDDGCGVLVRSDGRQSAAAYLDGDRVRLLAAAFSEGSGAMFLESNYAPRRRPLVAGSVLEDTVRLEPALPPQSTTP